MENNTSPQKEVKFNKPISVFEAIALQIKEDKAKETPEPEIEKEEKKEKGKGEFLFPITLLF